MQFRVLGPVEVVAAGAPLPLGGPRQRALLAFLLLHANEVVSTDRLIDDLWGANAPAGGPAAVQNQISRLRKALGSDRIQTRQAGYAIRVEPGELDLERHRHLVDAAAAAGPEERSALLAEAVGLWHGTVLSGLPDAPFVAAERARLEGLRLAALEERIDADLELGRHAELVGELSALAARHPLQERLRGQLMLALYRSGRQAEALDVYRETRTLLADELGLEPSHHLRDLERAILAQSSSLEPSPRLEQRPSGQVAEARGRPRHPYRVVAMALAAGLLGAAGALTAYALGREPGTEAAAPTTVPSTPSPAEPGSTSVARQPAQQPGTRQAPVTGTPATTSAATTTAPPAVAPTRETSVRTTPPRASGSSTTRAQTRGETTTAAPKLPTVMKPPAATTAAPPPHTTAPTGTTPTPDPGPRLLRIEDDFSSAAVDPTIWHTIKEGAGSGVTVQGGQVVVTIAADGAPGGTYNNVGAHVGTQCSFPADFDARVDFTLLEWAAADNVRAGLNAYYADGFVGRISSSAWGDQYVSWVVPVNGPVSLAEPAGSLRIARVGSTMTTYFWHSGHWVALASGASSGAAVIGLEAIAGTDFGHQETRVAFDNFAVDAVRFVCPPGSAPPGA